MTPAELQSLVDPFPVSETALLRRRGLLRRVDTKFVVPLDELASLLDGLEASYARLLANGASWASYKTLYFDTEGERFFHDHRRGRLGRHKVRVRHYLDRQVTFFEVKLKSNRGVTTKLRRRKEFGCSTLSAADLALGTNVPQVPLCQVVPRLWTLFWRLQLVGREHEERVTIDVGVGFRHGRTKRGAVLDELARSMPRGRPLVRELPAELRALAIVEVKQQRYQRRTPVMLALRRERLRRTRSSKYCTGVYLTKSTVPIHRFLPDFKKIARLQCSSC